MGACFQHIRLAGTLNKATVKRHFELAQEQDRYENGHSYSGGFGMCTGLTFVEKTFDGEEKASEWLIQNAQKWEDALCVRTANFWVIGAWCSS